MKLLSQLDSAANIKQDANNRFVTDAKIAEWNDKWDYNENTIKAVKVSNAVNADTVNNKTVSENVPAGAKFTDTVYTHPTTAGNKHIPTGGSTGQILQYAGSSGTAQWANAPKVTQIVCSVTEPSGLVEGDWWYKEV